MVMVRICAKEIIQKGRVGTSSGGEEAGMNGRESKIRLTLLGMTRLWDLERRIGESVRYGVLFFGVKMKRVFAIRLSPRVIYDRMLGGAM